MNVKTPLTAKAFRSRLEVNSAPTFLTLISIIQGVTLSFLVQNTDTMLSDPESKTSPHFLVFPAFSLLIIVSVFFLYSYFVNIDWRPPSIWEALIPFAIGVTQIIPTFYFNDPQIWYFAMAGMFVASTIGLANTYFGTKSEEFGSCLPRSYRLTRKETLLNIGITAGLAEISLLASWLRDPDQRQVYTFDWSVMAIFFTGCICLLIKSEFFFLRSLYEDASIQSDATKDAELFDYVHSTTSETVDGSTKNTGL